MALPPCGKTFGEGVNPPDHPTNPGAYTVVCCEKHWCPDCRAEHGQGPGIGVTQAIIAQSDTIPDATDASSV